MSEPASIKIASDLRALLANPEPAAALRVRRVTARTIRLSVAAADASQLVVFALAARAFFPGAAFGVWETFGLAVSAAVVGVAVRYALHKAAEPELRPAGPAARRAAVAVAVSLAATGATCWLALSQAGAPSSGVLGWFAVWFLASATAAFALRHGAACMADVLASGQRVVVVGAPDQAEPLARSVAEMPCGRWSLVGRVSDRDAAGLDRLAALVERRDADVVALAISGSDAAARIAAVCERLADQPVRVCLALDVVSLVHLPRALKCIGRFALVDLVSDPHGSLGGAAKRAMDVAVSGFALLALAPALAAVALAIRAESPGPVFFRQWRFGLGSRPILVFKFRTMREDGCDATGERRTTARDPRVTRVGRVLRRTSFDELPQLVNVLRGDMSLVGPRPHPLHMRVGDGYYFEAVERYRARHWVKPGITGWAQVNGSRGEVDTLEKARRRVALDLWYLDNWSLGLDLGIMARTVFGGFISPRAD